MAYRNVFVIVSILSVATLNGSFNINRPENGIGNILISKHDHHTDYNFERLMVIFSTHCEGIYDKNDNDNVAKILNTKMNILESIIVDSNKCLTRHGSNKYYKHTNKSKRIAFLNINKHNLNCIHSESIQFDYNQHCVDMFTHEPIFYLNNNYKIYENPSEYECISEDTASSQFTSTFPWGLNSISHHISYDSTDKPNYFYPNTSIDNGVDLFIIDSGVLGNHVEFYDEQVVHMQGNGPAMFKPYGNDSYMTWYADHGTHVAGIAGGINYGASKGLTIYDYRVCVYPAQSTNFDSQRCYASLFFEAFDGIMDQLINNKGRRGVINISIGGARIVFTIYGYYFDTITTLGGIIVIAAGNDNQDACVTEPAYLRSAITVGAYNSTRQKADFSNYGKCVDIWAPGVGIWSSVVACPGCDACGTCIGHKDGTSMAAPLITGMIANVLYVNPTLTFSQIKTILNENRIQITGEQCNSELIPCYGAVYQCNNTYNNISDYIETNTNQITPKDDYNLNSPLTNAYNCSAMVVYQYDADGKYSLTNAYGIDQCYSQRDYQGATIYSYKYQCNYTNNSVNMITYENSSDCSSTVDSEIANTFYNGQFDGLFKYFVHCNPNSNESFCNMRQREYSSVSKSDCSSRKYNEAKYYDNIYVKGLCYDSTNQGQAYSFTCINDIIYRNYYSAGNDSNNLVTTCHSNNFLGRYIVYQENVCTFDSDQNVYKSNVVDCGVNNHVVLTPKDVFDFNNAASNLYNCSGVVYYVYDQYGTYQSMVTKAIDICYSQRTSTTTAASSYMYQCNYDTNTITHLFYTGDDSCSSTPQIVKTFSNGEFDGTNKYFVNCNMNADETMCNMKIRTYQTSSSTSCANINYANAKYYDSIYQKGLCYDSTTKGKSYMLSCVNNIVYIDYYIHDSNWLVTTCNPIHWSSRVTSLTPDNCKYYSNDRTYHKNTIDCGNDVPFTLSPVQSPTSVPTLSPIIPQDEYDFNAISNIYNCSAMIKYSYDATGQFSSMVTYAVNKCYSFRTSENTIPYSAIYRCNFTDNSVDILHYTDDSCSSTSQLTQTIRNGDFADTSKWFVNCNVNADDNKCIITTHHYFSSTESACLSNDYIGKKYYYAMYQKGLCYDSKTNGKSYQLTCVNNTMYVDYYYNGENSNKLVTSCNPDNFQNRELFLEQHKCPLTDNLYDDVVIDCGEDFAISFKPTLKPTVNPDEIYNFNEKYTNPYNCSIMMKLKYISGKYNATYSTAVNQCYSTRTSATTDPTSYINRCNFQDNSIDVLYYANDTDCSSTPVIQKTITNGEYDGIYKYFINCNPTANDNFCTWKIRHYENSNYCLIDRDKGRYTDIIGVKGICYDNSVNGYSFSYNCIDNTSYADLFQQISKDSFITTCDPLNYRYTTLQYQDDGKCKFNIQTHFYDSYAIDCGSDIFSTPEPTEPTPKPSTIPSMFTFEPTTKPPTNPTISTIEPITTLSDYPTMLTTNNKSINDGSVGGKFAMRIILIVCGVAIAILILLIVLGVWIIKKRKRKTTDVPMSVYYELPDNDGKHNDDQLL
eukprot:221329_1